MTPPNDNPFGPPQAPGGAGGQEGPSQTDELNESAPAKIPGWYKLFNDILYLAQSDISDNLVILPSTILKKNEPTGPHNRGQIGIDPNFQTGFLPDTWYVGPPRTVVNGEVLPWVAYPDRLNPIYNVPKIIISPNPDEGAIETFGWWAQKPTGTLSSLQLSEAADDLSLIGGTGVSKEEQEALSEIQKTELTELLNETLNQDPTEMAYLEGPGVITDLFKPHPQPRIFNDEIFFEISDANDAILASGGNFDKEVIGAFVSGKGTGEVWSLLDEPLNEDLPPESFGPATGIETTAKQVRLDPIRSAVGNIWTQDPKTKNSSQLNGAFPFALNLSIYQDVEISNLTSENKKPELRLNSSGQSLIKNPEVKPIAIKSNVLDAGDAAEKQRVLERMNRLREVLIQTRKASNEDFFGGSEVPWETPGRFYDFYTTYENPLSARFERPAEFESSYESFIKTYESGIDVFSEAILPNFNVSVAAQRMREILLQKKTDSNIWKFVTVNGEIDLALSEQLITKSPLQDFTQTILRGQNGYFSQWVLAARQAGPDLLALEDSFDTIILPASATKASNDEFGHRGFFPMYTALSFKTDPSAVLATSISKSLIKPATFFFLDGENNDYRPVFDYSLMKMMVETNFDGNLFEIGLGQEAPLFFKSPQKGGFYFTKTPGSFIDAGVFREADLIYWFNNLNDGTALNFVPSQKEDKNYAPIAYTSETVGGEFKYKNIKDSNELRTANEPDLRELYVDDLGMKIVNTANTNLRDLQQIYSGIPAYSENLFYRIEKSKVNAEGNEEILQEYYIANSSEIDVQNFVDSQVKYDQEYIYRVYAWHAVIGNEVEYDLKNSAFIVYGDNGTVLTQIVGDDLLTETFSLNFEDARQYEFFIIAKNNPSVKIVELPYYKFKTRILDRPPVFPTVDFKPFKNVTDRILVSLEPNTGEYKAAPIAILDEDIPKIDKQKRVQKIISELGVSNMTNSLVVDIEAGGGIIEDIILEGGGNLQPGGVLEVFTSDTSQYEFKTEDPPAYYEMFRLETPPKSYADFKDARYTRYDLERVVSIGRHDNLKSNTKYYYTFRIGDVHDNISNPTEVFQVELVQVDNAVYLDVKVYEFPTPELITSKPMRKHINIVPSLDQAVTNIDRTFPTEEMDSYVGLKPALGIEGESLFDNGNKFKVRLTSKSSGKKIDINLNFKTTKKKTPIETEILSARAKKSTSNSILFGEGDKFKDKSVVVVGQAETFIEDE